MTIGRSAIVLSTLLLAGCISEQGIQATVAEATKTAGDHCRSEGKQFIVTKTEIGSDQDTIFHKRVRVEGICVGPGDPGYVAPAAAD